MAVALRNRICRAGDGGLPVSGGIGGLVPVFEAKASSKYGFVNEDKWLSSSPASTAGIGIAIYEKR